MFALKRNGGAMKDYYKISEISRLYDIGNDSLRYYEKIGILKPKRDLNDYRMYGLADIATLNVIKELKNLGFGMKKIKEFLEDRNIEKTLEVLEVEISEIDKKISELGDLRKNLFKRRTNIIKESSETNFGEIKEIFLSTRKCIHLNDKVMREEEVDFMIKRLQDKYNENLYILGNSMIGATVDIDLKKIKNEEIYNLEDSYKFSTYSSVFFVVDENKDYDFVVPESKFISVKYRGNYNKTNFYIMKMMEYAIKHKLSLISNPLEIYHIDIHETSIINEFITEIQIGFE